MPIQVPPRSTARVNPEVANSAPDITLTAIPAVVAYNVFQRRVKRTLAEADALANISLGAILSQDESEADA